MYKLFFIAAIFIYISIVLEVHAQLLETGCERSVIESYSGNEKQHVLLYLNETRQFTDEFMRLFVENRFEEIYKLNKNLKILIGKDSGQGVILTNPETVRQKYGQITHYEYHNQFIAFLIAGPIYLNDPVDTIYRIKTADSGGDAFLLSVRTRKSKFEDKLLLQNVSLTKLVTSNAAKRENPKSSNKQETCSGMKNGLKVKLP